MSTIKVDTIATRTGSGNITLSNNVASLTSAGAISGTNITASGNITGQGTAAITSNTTVGGTLGVTGVSTLSGNVGVGAAPNNHGGMTRVLEISGSADVQLALHATSDSLADNARIGEVAFMGGSDSTTRILSAIVGRTSGTSEASGQLSFHTRGTDSAGLPTERMRIDQNGHVTMPSQPCFSATADTTNIPLGTSTTVALSGERFDVGSNLDSNTFTAPISGKYLFCFMFYFSSVDADHTTLDAHIKTSNKQYQVTFSPDHFLNSDSNFSITGSMICDMDANDTCFFTTYVQAGAAQTDIHSDSQVSGALIC